LASRHNKTKRRQQLAKAHGIQMQTVGDKILTEDELEIKETMWGLAKADLTCGCESFDAFACYNKKTRIKNPINCDCACHINGKCPCGCGMRSVIPQLS